MLLQTGNENQAFLTKWINSHADACKAIGKPFVLEEFGKNVTAKAKTPEDWKAQRTPMFSRAYSEYISSLENGGNYQGQRQLCISDTVQDTSIRNSQVANGRRKWLFACMAICPFDPNVHAQPKAAALHLSEGTMV